ncbi:F0F1 ATP synthase subunit epsilon [Aquicoccus sp. SCR17]|nr:F0F1 ATP synthase subunit epsilon [Carideicomes alvinocaridis]
MADTMQFDLVSPERQLASLEARAVQVPGAEGDLTFMPGHTPLITTLRPGLLRVESAEGDKEYVVSGGFAEMGAGGLSVLAERALPREDMTQERYDEMLEELKSQYQKAKDNFQNEPGPVDDAAKLLSDMVAVGGHIGLSAGNAPLPG